ncbi:hypothetical protein Tco_0978175 [Tanacetum coccineum]|uniref:DUF1985 domain-containing protein n=1 Tax=Tanacetum coccineum TaxID=301880 RepID=A0ABQ5EM54_9ASTR
MKITSQEVAGKITSSENYNISLPAYVAEVQSTATVKVKTINGEIQLQALVDGKKIIVTKASVRRDLQLNDEEGTNCLPNATIFEELTRMGYEKLSQKLTFYKAFFSPQRKFLIHTILQCLSAKTTAWNKFSSTMASAIICLSTNQKFNFSKYIFESMVKNLDNAGKFLMYPRNMRRVGKGFSGKETPLFQAMMVQVQEEMGKDNVANEAVNKEMDDSLVTAATITTGLDTEQDSGNIDKTQSKATLNKPSSLGTSSGSGPRRQETMRDTIAQTRFENVSKTSNDSLLAGVNIPRKKKGGSRTHKLKRLYKVGRSARVISSNEASLGDQEDASKQGRKIDDIDKDVEITLVHKTQKRYGDEEIFDTGILDDDEVLAEPEVIVKDVNLSVDEVTLAQALAALKSAKVQEKANVIEEPSESITTTPTLTTTTAATTITAVKAQDKGKGIMVEEHVKMKKKDQISLDEELAFKLQAEEEEEEERLAREKAQREEEANIVSWDNV